MKMLVGANKLTMMIRGSIELFKLHPEEIVYGDRNGKTIIFWLDILKLHTAVIKNQQQSAYIPG